MVDKSPLNKEWKVVKNMLNQSESREEYFKFLDEKRSRKYTSNQVIVFTLVCCLVSSIFVYAYCMQLGSKFITLKHYAYNQTSMKKYVDATYQYPSIDTNRTCNIIERSGCDSEILKNLY